MAASFAEILRDFRPGTRVRVRPDTEAERYALRHGLSVVGTVIGVGPSWGERVRVEWDHSHPGDSKRPKHRETIALEAIEPL